MKEKTPNEETLFEKEKVSESTEVSEDLKSLAEKLEKQMSALVIEIDEVSNELLSSSDITDSERAQFLLEVAEFKSELTTSKEELVEKIEAAELDAISEGEETSQEIENLDVTEMVSEQLSSAQERVQGIEGVGFILNNLPIKDSEKIKEEYEKQKEYKYGKLPVPHFPLDETGLQIMQTMMKKSPENLYDLKNLIQISDQAFVLMQRGVSVETLGKIDQGDDISGSSFEHILEDEDMIEKILLLDKTDFNTSDKTLNHEDLRKVSSSQMKLLVENPHITFQLNDSWYFGMDQVGEHLTEENLKKFKQFDEDATDVPVSEFIAFIKNVVDLPPRIQSICKEKYNEGEKMRALSFENGDVLKNLDEAEVTKLITLLEYGIVDSLNQRNLEKFLQLSELVFERFSALERNVKGVSLEDLIMIDTMSQESFDFCVETRAVYIPSSLSESVELSEKIFSTLGIDDGRLFLEWSAKGDQVKNFEYNTSNLQNFESLQEMFEVVKQETDISLFDFVTKAYGDKAVGYESGENREYEVLTSSKRFEENPESIILDILSRTEGLEHTFINFQAVQEMLKVKDIEFNEEQVETLFSSLLAQKPSTFLETNTFPLTEEQRKLVVGTLSEHCPLKILDNFSLFEKEYLPHADEKQDTLDTIFRGVLDADPYRLSYEKDFPFTEEQKQYIAIFEKIKNSQSQELQNLASEITPLLAQQDSTEDALEALEKIEEVFLTNNIPLVGKQYKVFEILYPNKKLSDSVENGKVDSLKTLNNSAERRLEIFKDLVRAHLASADSNLEQYITVLKNGREVLATFESGDALDEDQRQELIFFLKKISAVSNHSGREGFSVNSGMSDEQIAEAIKGLEEGFGAREGENLVQKFERTFLSRIGIDSVDDALDEMESYRNDATQRNEAGAASGFVSLKQGDLVKNISSNYLDNYLDSGIYSPEFVGAGSQEAMKTSKSSDLTPFDTDLFQVSNNTEFSDGFNSGYGDIMLVLKQKEQFEKDNLDIFKTGVISEDHYGIRTGFGSTQIDAIYIGTQEKDDRKIDELKFFIAKKGFYIPLCGADGEVIFTKEEFDIQRKIFSGIDRFHGDEVVISDAWKSSEQADEILTIAQTTENIEDITKVRDVVMDKILKILSDEGVALHEGKFDDNIKGAIISDTGSTGRGSSLDEAFDFDFAVKLDEADWDKVSAVMEKISAVFPKADQYENRGMKMFRSEEVEIDNLKMTIDVGFNKKTNSEEFDAHDALIEKYQSIKEGSGSQAHLDTLTNIRYTKKKLKEAGCYKKGSGGEGQQGGLGGIGVEYWILQNEGDAVKAFKDFESQAFEDGTIIPFEAFKQKYKIFSAGQNIRGAVKVENFIDNMTEEGYIKMAKLAQEL